MYSIDDLIRERAAEPPSLQLLRKQCHRRRQQRLLAARGLAVVRGRRVAVPTRP